MSFGSIVRIRAGAPLAAALALVVVGVGAGDARAQSPAGGDEGVTVLDGVYTVTQAQQGDEVFSTVCSLCHTINDFVHGVLKPAGKFENLGDMFVRISTMMPMDNPGSLSWAEYAAVMSYILQQNGYPAGETELPADIGKLIPIRIVPPPGQGDD